MNTQIAPDTLSFEIIETTMLIVLLAILFAAWVAIL